VIPRNPRHVQRALNRVEHQHAKNEDPFRRREAVSPDGLRLQHRQANRNHILTKKASKRKRQLRGLEVVAKGDTPGLDRMLPTKAR